MKLPLISVVIPTYNQALYLPFALDSVLTQTYSNIEIIVINDGSTDNTEALGQIYQQKDQRIKWITQSNQGPSRARNHGIQIAQGEYIALLDGDDLMDSHRLMTQWQTLTHNSSIDIVYTALVLINEKGEKIGELHSQSYAPENFLALMLFRNLIPGPSTVMTKSGCLKTHPYHLDYLHAEDYELMLRLAQHYQFFYLDLPLTSYRRHDHNLSNNLAAHRKAELKVLQSYSLTQIESIVQKTSLKIEEKTLLKAKILYNQARFEQALEIFQQLSLPIALFYQGNCQLKCALYMQAAELYEKSLGLDPSNAACWNNLGVVYHHLQKLDKTNTCFQQALMRQPHYLDAQHNLLYPSDLKVTWRELRPQLIPYQ